ncbi:MAG: N-acetylmuramoyl-L-alanine amidase [Mariprofundaceae bacterium]
MKSGAICLRICFVMLALLFVAQPAALAKSSNINDVRLWTAPDHTRLVFDLNGTIEYKVFPLHKPERIVIDLQGVQLKANLSSLKLPDPVIGSLRHGEPKPKVLRIVLDIKERVKTRSFLLKPMHGKPHRLVVDLIRYSQTSTASRAVTADQLRSKKDIVIAVDAGHGGEDPGAIGRHGLQEKRLTLAVAKALAKEINARSGMRAILTRKGDYYVPLKKRVKLARRSKADLMISIHADAVKNRGVKGMSVYTLSERGATPDKVAAALASRENAADDVGGFVASEVDDPMVNMILGDMAKRDSLNSAYLLAETLLKDFGRVGPIKYKEPKRARFVVLGALEMPSVLVELDFISNPKRERLLRSKTHQQKMASALLNSSLTFLRRQGRLKKASIESHQIVMAGLSAQEMVFDLDSEKERQSYNLPNS